MRVHDYRKLIYSTYGAVTRARGPYLYTKKGRRLLDLYQEGGRAILGYGKGKSFSVFKRVLDRGATGFWTTEASMRLSYAVSRLVKSHREAVCFYDKESALKCAIDTGHPSPVVWRAWDTTGEDYSRAEVVLIAPPLAWHEDIYILALPKGSATDMGIIYPAPLVAAIMRSIFDYIAQEPIRGESQWRIYDKALSPYFSRKGCYLSPKVLAVQYDAFIAHCLKLGIVISPEYNVPSIVPYGANVGDFTLLVHTPFSG